MKRRIPSLPGMFHAAALLAMIALGNGAASPSQQGGQAPSAQAAGKLSTSEQAVQQALQAGFAFYERNDYARADAEFQRILAIGEQTHNASVLGQGHRGLGVVLYARSEYGRARQELDQALALCRSAADAYCVAETQQDLGMVAQETGDWSSARQLYQSALKEFRAHGDGNQQANVLRNLAMDPALSNDQVQQDIQTGLTVLGSSGSQEVAGGLLEDWGDVLFSTGDYARAIEKLEAAQKCFENTGDRMSLARVLVSEGRIYRAHGIPARALDFYQRALFIERAVNDRFGEAQTLNALAVAYSALGQQEVALALYESALSLARKTGSEALVTFLLGNIAAQHLEMNHYAVAARMLEEVLSLQKSPYLRANLFIQLSTAEMHLGQDRKALNAANNGLALAAKFGDDENLFYGCYWRAQAEDALGQKAAALADVSAALKTLEGIRQRLVPVDYMKQGFMDRGQFLFNFAITLLEQQGQDVQALAESEEARARAFADLLASRNVKTQPVNGEIAAAEELEAQSRSVADSRAGSGVPTVGLTLRGEKSGAALAGAEAPTSAPNLPSPSSSPPFTIDDIRGFAARHRATILSYWVGPEATFIWVVQPDGSIHSARVRVASARLERLVRELWPRPRLEEASRSGPGEGPSRQSTRAAGTAGNREGRGGMELKFASQATKNWRELYILLIEPVERYLPAAKGSLLTIEPQGPLLLLPFAALVDAHGHYLLERYCLNYTPSLSLFPYLSRDAKVSREAQHYLLVADPADPAPAPNGVRLASLPGARQEVSAIARLLPSDRVTLLEGRQAQEDKIESRLASSTVIHFATHAIVNDDSPWDSYLALGEDENPRDSGRLTVADVYSFKLHASLVFLSACRTGMGKVSGDGIAGLTRAFVYAGASSVIASLADVSDETTVRLVPDFYKNWLKGKSKAEALREAQLRLMHDLRAGRVRIRTPYGTFALPEDPVLWASFVLEGEP